MNIILRDYQFANFKWFRQNSFSRLNSATPYLRRAVKRGRKDVFDFCVSVSCGKGQHGGQNVNGRTPQLRLCGCGKNGLQGTQDPWHQSQRSIQVCQKSGFKVTLKITMRIATIQCIEVDLITVTLKITMRILAATQCIEVNTYLSGKCPCN